MLQHPLFCFHCICGLPYLFSLSFKGENQQFVKGISLEDVTYSIRKIVNNIVITVHSD